MSRPRHPRKELEALLREAERQAWQVTKSGGYFKIWCSCSSKHKKVVHLTPSSRYYENNLRTYLKNHACWRA